MSLAIWPYAAFTSVVIAALLFFERRKDARGIWVTKPLAALGFFAAGFGLAASPLGGYERLLLLGLLLSALGDVLLIPKEKRFFLLGLFAFLLAHVAYSAAFFSAGVDGTAAILALLPLLGVALVVMRWLWPHLSSRMRGPVLTYVVVISAMVALAFGAAFAGAPQGAAAGALAFYLSDLMVARQRFVAPSFVNKLVGLPLYFGAQLVLASTLPLI